ncbi:hypothetical protein EUX98_g662 [Antrodiella citrinella]|uniref:CN hydrolase domain-containing protein n=1 Tax=Antrodiella citrinella TaxID=2447956 RepID=A0A4S4N6G7_9APHY|nr:hypothetical protein EUX98_g662 [Antrodiella citrinella]
MANTIRASVVQACTAAYSLEKTLEKLEKFARIAKERDHSQLVVFPEAFIGGYPKMSNFGARVGERQPSGRDEYLRYHSAAIEVPSPAITELERISKDLDVFIVTGIIERDGGTLYCTAIFIDPVQGYVTKHRKLMPTGVERIIWGQGDATTLPVPEVSFKSQFYLKDDHFVVKAKLSATICWENYMPLLRTFYYSKGTQIYCAPTVDARPEWQHTMRHIALEGRCFVLSACQYAEEKDYPEDHPVDNEANRNPKNVMIAGGSVIVGPLAQVLAGPLLGEEGVLTADLDLDDVVRGKFDLDVTGHYARPETGLMDRFLPLHPPVDVRAHEGLPPVEVDTAGSKSNRKERPDRTNAPTATKSRRKGKGKELIVGNQRGSTSAKATLKKKTMQMAGRTIYSVDPTISLPIEPVREHASPPSLYDVADIHVPRLSDGRDFLPVMQDSEDDGVLLFSSFHDSDEEGIRGDRADGDWMSVPISTPELDWSSPLPSNDSVSPSSPSRGQLSSSSSGERHVWSIDCYSTDHHVWSSDYYSTDGLGLWVDESELESKADEMFLRFINSEATS